MLIWWIYPNILQDLREKTLVEFRDDTIACYGKRKFSCIWIFPKYISHILHILHIHSSQSAGVFRSKKGNILKNILWALFSSYTILLLKNPSVTFYQSDQGTWSVPKKDKGKSIKRTLSSQRLKSYFRTWFFGHCCCPKADKLIKWRKNEKLHPNEDSLSNVNPITVASCFSVIGNKNVFWARFWFQNIHF